MNISGIVVKTEPQYAESLIENFKESELCDFHIYENGNIILTIEGESVSDEMGKLKQIERFPHVLSAQMVYSYCEDELEEGKEFLSKNKAMPEWLNDEKMKAEDIPPYQGDVRKIK